MKRSKNGCDESDQFKSEGVYIQWELGYGEKIGHTNCQAQGQRETSSVPKRTKLDPEERSVMGWPTTTT